MAYHYGLPEIARAPNEMKALHSWGRTVFSSADLNIVRKMAIMRSLH